MRTTINPDDELLAQAQHLTGWTDGTQLVREALLALVQRESARRLARLADTQAQLQASVPRPRDGSA